MIKSSYLWALGWRLKQALARPGRYYGNGGTIHGSTHLDVEVHGRRIVSVWFRCQPLPFHVTEVNGQRAAEMDRMYKVKGAAPALTGVEVVDRD